MISEKMCNLGKQASVIREIFEYSKMRKAEIGEENVYDFSLGNPSVPSPQKVTDVLAELISTKEPTALHGYTSAVGDNDVRKAIADDLNQRFNADVKPSLIYMTCGAAASLTISLKALCNPGDEVIVTTPFFPEYTVFIENAMAVKVEVPCKKEDFTLDINAIAKAVTPKTKAIIINSPNNPSGVVFPKENIEALSKLLKEKSEEYNSEIFIISDEPYRELVYDNTYVPFIPEYYDNTLVCYSYSKSLSLPGERIGYIYVSSKSQNSYDIYKAVCGAGRIQGYVCAPSLMQYAVGKCTDQRPDISAYDINRKLIYNELLKIGYEPIKPQGAFYLFLKSLEEDANAFCERAKKYELMLVPSDSFGIKGYVRVSYCVDNAMIKRSLKAFKALFDEYNG